MFMSRHEWRVAPNDCIKWGPGLTSAGAACNSVTGGAHPANQLTIYTSHAGLVANVTTPTEAWTVVQQGFYAPGDGGDATYQWSFTSYCGVGTLSAPGLADGFVCVLPAGQAASTAGRYLLSANGELNARLVGMQAGGFDNYPLVQGLMNAIAPSAYNERSLKVVFPATLGQIQTVYYFSKPFTLARNTTIDCKSASVPNQSAVVLVFPPGSDGVIYESGYYTPDGSWGQASINGCQISGLGVGGGNVPLFVQSAITNAGGSGYGAGTGTLTVTTAGFCSVAPVLNATAVGGVITVINSIATPGVCNQDVNNRAVWTAGGGLNSAGTGFTATTIMSSNTNSLTNVSLGNIVQPQFFTPPASCNPHNGSCTIGNDDGLVAFNGGTSILSITNGAYVALSDPVAKHSRSHLRIQ